MVLKVFFGWFLGIFSKVRPFVGMMILFFLAFWLRQGERVGSGRWRKLREDFEKLLGFGESGVTWA